MKKPCAAFLLLASSICFSQEKDSLKTLDEVTVRAFEQYRQQKLSAVRVYVLGQPDIDRSNKTSLVHGISAVPGVRVEERSPGSYRINMRGSSLRSPFGVRNVKIYWNNLPLTDAGGNTYFNQLAYNNFSTLEIFKGPAGSMYGAGTGGLILVNNFDNYKPGLSVEYMTGSDNLQNFFGTLKFGSQSPSQVTFAHNGSDGYRVQSKMRRDNFSWTSRLTLSERQQLTASFLFTDMDYQTPGALTLAEYSANPKAARPAAGAFPSAVGAHASISQKTALAGFTHQYTIVPGIKNTTSLFGSFAQIKNAAIRNYERRYEPGFGGRSLFTFSSKKSITDPWQLVVGSEFQQGYFSTQVSKNKNGNPDTLQTDDDVNNTLYHIFIQGDWQIAGDWIINAGVGFSKYKIAITRINQYPVITQSRNYKNEFAPRLAIRKNFKKEFSWLASVARGFSPPTTAEVLPSTGVISTNLEAEEGWNYETSLVKSFFGKKLQLEVTGFYFQLDKALVQRRDVSGADYFVNAGKVDQKGIEVFAGYTQLFNSASPIDYINLRSAYSYNHFRYEDYIRGVDDFTGKTLPSVPSHTISLLADLQLRNGFFASITGYTASRIFLNDANSAVADSYKLLGSRIGWKKTLSNKYRIQLYIGGDNLLDERYSLGNDINAAAGRYYNAAPGRNYYAGIGFGVQ